MLHKIIKSHLFYVAQEILDWDPKVPKRPLPKLECEKPLNKGDFLNFQKMPNVDLAVKAEVVNYDRHGFSRPNLWHRPIAKVTLSQSNDDDDNDYGQEEKPMAQAYCQGYLIIIKR